jgi:hypothetical protein
LKERCQRVDDSPIETVTARKVVMIAKKENERERTPFF